MRSLPPRVFLDQDARSALLTDSLAVAGCTDIGSNLGDPVFRGSYHGKQAHAGESPRPLQCALVPFLTASFAFADDFADILGRARRAGVGMQLLTGDCVEGSKEVLALAQQHRASSASRYRLAAYADTASISVEGLYATVGCHPCRATEPDAFPGGATAYFEALDKLIADNKGKGKALFIGECGLDYDRLHLAPKEAQLRYAFTLVPLHGPLHAC